MKFLTSDEAEGYCLEKLNEASNEVELQKIINLTKLYSLKELTIQAYIELGKLSYYKHNYNIAFSYFNESLSLIEKEDNKLKIGYVYNLLGACKHAELKYMEALQYFDEAIIYAMMYKDEVTEINSILNSAMCYRRLSWLDKAIEYADLCLIRSKDKIGLDKYINANLIKINCYEDKQVYGKAIKLSEQLIKDIQDKELLIIGNIYNNLGGLYLSIGEIEKSLESFDKSMEFRKLKDIETLSHTIIDKAKVYVYEKLYQQAVELLNLGCNMALKYNDYDYAIRGYKELIEIYISTSDFKKAEDLYLKTVNLLRDKDSQELKKTYLKLSKFYIKQGKLDEADKYLNLSQE
jgi:tetratricopeptide (TPR) repeat protein